MKKVLSYMSKHKLGYVIAVLSMIISVSLDMLAPQLTKRVIDDVIVGGDMSRLGILLVGFLSIGVGRCIFQYTKEYIFDRIGSSVACELRKDLFRHIQSLSADFFDRTNTGELMARVKDDVDRIWEALTFVGMLILEVFIHTVIILVCMAGLSPSLTVIPAVAMVICGTIAIVLERKLGVTYEAISEENAQLNTVAEENLAGVRTVKAFAREKFEISKFLSHNKRYYDLNMEQSRVFAKYNPYFQIITKILPLVIILLGSRSVMNGGMTLGTLGAFVEYSMNIVWPMEILGWLSNSISSAFASGRKISAIYEEKPSITQPEHPVTLDPVQGNIVFNNVGFHKADMHNILTDISFGLESGKTLGIMGATGAGKSSMIHLLLRLYDATEGTILLDGVDIRNLSLEQLRGSISVVSQDTFLFSDTISENVRLGKKDSLDAGAVRYASRKAMASEFIENMNQQYDTVIGERGIGLSGGQKQRISIARALARKSPVLVLDDSTSALDMETESQIHETLDSLTNTTKIIIAHRISAVRKADEIIVLDDGCIRERGTHEELLAHKGLYYKTFLAQYGQETPEILKKGMI